MNSKIGGFFELELKKGESNFHGEAISLTTGRACLNYILKVTQPAKLYLPFYCCNALLEPVIENEIEFEFYGINSQLEIDQVPTIKSDEFLLYTNFFGVKSGYTSKLVEQMGSRLIIDNTHSYFTRKLDDRIFSFNSARKYFGVPDGAFLYVPENSARITGIARNQSVSIAHSLHRLLGLQEIAYKEYVAYENELSADIKNISLISEILLSQVDYAEVRRVRDRNFNYIHEQLGQWNTLSFDRDLKDCFCYPLLLKRAIKKPKLWALDIFVPSFWLDVLDRPNKAEYGWECQLSVDLIPLPVDHRYGIEDLEYVCTILKDMMNE